MIWNLIGTLALGIAVASVVFVLFRLTGRPAPRWLLPAAAGASMLGFHIWSDYSWFGRTTQQLPEHVEVAASFTSSNVMQPWTLVFPRTARFVAVDRDAVRRHPDVDGLAMATVYLVARWNPTLETHQLYDCATPRRADIGDGFEVDAKGRPVDPDWIELPADDPVRRVVCATERTHENELQQSMIGEHLRWLPTRSWWSTTSRASAST